MSKSQFSVTKGVVSVTADTIMSINQVVDVSQYSSIVFALRVYGVGVTGTLAIETSTQNTDATDALWDELASVTLSAVGVINVPLTANKAPFSYIRWNFDASGGSGTTTFEIIGYGIN